jgi:hypothetical protein
MKFTTLFLPNRSNTLLLISLIAMTVLVSCKSETLFKSNFDATPVNQPPAPTQAIGTAKLDGPAGSVIVVPSPVGTGGKWAKITRTSNATSVSVLQCNNIKLAGAGKYNFSAVLFIPKGNSGPATVQFEQFGQPVETPSGFLHLDFMPNGQIRLDDNEDTKFGHFPTDSAFIVQVTFTINATVQTAHIVLAGAGASGILDYTILPPFRIMAQQFGAVRLWMGFPWVGFFDATTIVVTKNN